MAWDIDLIQELGLAFADMAVAEVLACMGTVAGEHNHNWTHMVSGNCNDIPLCDNLRNTLVDIVGCLDHIVDHHVHTVVDLFCPTVVCAILGLDESAFVAKPSLWSGKR